MKLLETVIEKLNKEEIRHFKLFLNRTNSGGEERKDIALFDAIRASLPDYDEEKIFKMIYSDANKNSFYRLKNRLLNELSKSILLQHYDFDGVSEVLNNIALARLFQHKGETKIAYQYFKKAEKIANEEDYLEMKELIYSEYIKLSNETIEINPEEYIKKRKENRLKLKHLQEIDDVLAVVTYRVKTSQNFSKQNNQILELLEKTVHDFSNSNEVKKNPQLRFKIYHSVSKILLQKNDFVSMEKYLLKTFDEFGKEGLFNKNNHETKLQMLTYIVNSLFKNDKIELSLAHTEKLKKAMEEFDNVLYEKYLFYYYNSLVINYSKKDMNKAIEILNEARENPTIKKLPAYVVFIYLNLSVLHFDKKEFKPALKNIIKLQMHSSYLNLNEVLRYKIAIAEMIIRFELDDFDFIQHSIKRMKNDFASLVNDPNYLRAKEMIAILLLMINTTAIKKNKKLISRINSFIASVSDKEAAEVDIINCNEWLKSKI